MEYFELNNGVKVPKVGYGVYQSPKNRTVELVKNAIEAGCRHIDTAQNYANEREVGIAINESGVSRDDVFVTTKTQTDGYESTLRGIDHSLDESGFDYFDMILIHWPVSDNTATYRALEEALVEGKCRAIGVSNFNAGQFLEITDKCDIKPAVNQIETHIMWQQQKMHEFLKQHDCLHESWSPFSSGNFNVFENETLLGIAENHSKTVAQIILRFLVQSDIAVIPKSSSINRMRENLDIFDFNLTSNEMSEISVLDENRSYCNWPYTMRQW